MRDYREAKPMAKALQKALTARNFEFSHSDCLELVARQYGLDSWNVLAARLKSSEETPSLLNIPKGWIISGVHAELFEAGTEILDGGKVASIRSRRNADLPDKSDFLTLMQSIDAGVFRGKRLHLQAELKTEAVTGIGTLWMRVDGQPKSTLKFDNLEQRSKNGPLSGSMDWTQRHVVLDVPEEAQSIHYGFFLQRSGQVWCRKVALDVVGSEVAETMPNKYPLDRPSNLDFLDIAE